VAGRVGWSLLWDLTPWSGKADRTVRQISDGDNTSDHKYARQDYCRLLSDGGRPIVDGCLILKETDMSNQSAIVESAPKSQDLDGVHAVRENLLRQYCGKEFAAVLKILRKQENPHDWISQALCLYDRAVEIATSDEGHRPRKDLVQKFPIMLEESEDPKKDRQPIMYRKFFGIVTNVLRLNKQVDYDKAGKALSSQMS